MKQNQGKELSKLGMMIGSKIIMQSASTIGMEWEGNGNVEIRMISGINGRKGEEIMMGMKEVIRTEEKRSWNGVGTELKRTNNETKWK